MYKLVVVVVIVITVGYPGGIVLEIEGWTAELIRKIHL